MELAGIDTIILDLGGVLIDVDYQRTAKEFTKLGYGNFDSLYSKAKQSSVFDEFETGHLSPSGFCQKIRELVSPDLSDVQIVNGWNAMLGTIPQERIELIQQLRNRFQLLLLSNTNAIHVPAFEEIIALNNGIGNFKSLFDGAYYSCEIGLRKPHAEAFHYVLDKHDAKPSKTLFVDDSIQHVEGAKAAGLHAVHLELETSNVFDLFTNEYRVKWESISKEA